MYTSKRHLQILNAQHKLCLGNLLFHANTHTVVHVYSFYSENNRSNRQTATWFTDTQDKAKRKRL